MEVEKEAYEMIGRGEEEVDKEEVKKTYKAGTEKEDEQEREEDKWMDDG